MSRSNGLEKVKVYKAPNPYKQYTGYKNTIYEDDTRSYISRSSKISRASKASHKSKLKTKHKKHTDYDEFKRFNENVSVTSKQVTDSRKVKRRKRSSLI